MSYLQRLRGAAAENMPTPGTALTAKSPFDSFGSTQSDRISATDAELTHFRWSVAYTDVEAMEVCFSPEATRAQVAALYPGAMVEPLPDESVGDSGDESDTSAIPGRGETGASA